MKLTAGVESQFHQHFTYKFVRTLSFRHLFSTYVRKKASKKTFVQKMRGYNVDEIDTSGLLVGSKIMSLGQSK